MANPSLQIGNDNWAIKEDNLLGYSTAGTRFVPQPITMTRASAGTRVNPSGLVEDVALLGSELVTNGDFATNTDWDKKNGSTISGGVGNIIANGSISSTGDNWGLYQNNIFIPSENYRINFRARQTNGTGNFQVGYSWGFIFNQTITSSFVDYTIDFTTSSNGWENALTFGGLTIGDTFEIDNISVKESTKNNLARVDYDGTASSLLAEPQRTNLVTYSEVYGAGTFFSATSGSTIDNTTSISPSGDANATQVTSTGAGKIQSGALGLTQNTDYVLSFYAKNVDATLVNSRVYATGGTGGSNLTSVDYTSQLSTTEWTRITHSFNTGTNTTIYVYLSNALNSGGTIQLWGAQLEEGSYATSYIPTDGGTVTRVQDQYSKTGISNLINSEEGVLFVELENITGTDATNKMISITDGSLTNKISLFVSSNQISVESAGSGTNLGIYSKALQSGFNKIAVKYKVNDCALWVNGTEYTDTSFAAFTSSTLNALVFDRGDGTQNLFGKVKQLQVYKTALTDTELATLTTI